MGKWQGWICVAMLSACGPVVTNPAPPPHSGPRFSLLSQPASPGRVFFDVTAAERLVGRIELPSGLTIAHPLRLAVLWSAEFQSTTGVLQTLSPRFDGRAGEQSFDTTVASPPEEVMKVLAGTACTTGRFASSHGQVILFEDVNENGELDRFDSTAIDRVLGASTFPLEFFGFGTGGQVGLHFQEACGPGKLGSGGQPVEGQRSEVTFKLFDDRRLDVVACTAPAVFASSAPCGITLRQRPVINFGAYVADGTASLSFHSSDSAEVFVDDQSHGVISGGGLSVSDPGLLEGEHRVRVEAAGMQPWEATVTLPQPLVILSRPAVLKSGQRYDFVWSSQPGVKRYFFAFDLGHGRDSIEAAGPSVSYLQAAPGFEQSSIHFDVSTGFADFPGGAAATFEIPLEAAQ